ncbi:MAG TPA: hypothetical protein VFR55_07935 [Dehalococcoidia bacterium]|nr:hypothetical protein [Dehalococcoidia bacterium]
MAGQHPHPGVDDREIVDQLSQGGAEITGEVSSSIWPLVLSWGIPLALAQPQVPLSYPLLGAV